MKCLMIPALMIAFATPVLADEATLPSVESIGPSSDITVFMRPGVPDEVRNAALRRMWSVNVTIRDFTSEASDYSAGTIVAARPDTGTTVAAVVPK